MLAAHEERGVVAGEDPAVVLSRTVNVSMIVLLEERVTFAQPHDPLERNPAEDPCLKRINMLAHSMGNRVLRETLWAWNKYDLPIACR